MRVAIAAVLAAGVCGSAQAQSVVNGDFETGDLTGWTVEPLPNGTTQFQNVEMYDIDGPLGPQGASFTGQFNAGNITATGNQTGIELVQEVQLTAGTEYTFSFDWAAYRTFAGVNSEGGVFSVVIGTEAFGTTSAGDVSFDIHKFGSVEVQYSPTLTGPHRVGIRITRPYTLAGDLFQHVDNFTIASGAVCYANCDGSTVEPVLNVDDFTCFINEFAAAQNLPHEQQVEHYANCDGSSIAPALNVDDFTCFINAFAAGCP